jgi:hypothetical protein
MHVELKKVKFHEDMSDETNCFSAEVWVDGKKLADVSNHGQGGENEYHHLPGMQGDLCKFEEWCKTLPPLPATEDFPLTLPMNADLYISNLFDAWLTKDCERRRQALMKRPKQSPTK